MRKAGNEVFKILNKGDEYEKGLFLLAQQIRDMLRYQFYILRLSETIPKTPLKKTIESTDKLMRIDLIVLLNNTCALGIRKLIEKNKASWNFAKLLGVTKSKVKHEHFVTLEHKVTDYQARWAEFKAYGDQVAAHIGDRANPASATIIVNVEHAVLGAMEILDHFVVGEINYEIESDNDPVVKLRDYMKTISSKAPRFGPNNLPNVIDLQNIVR